MRRSYTVLSQSIKASSSSSPLHDSPRHKLAVPNLLPAPCASISQLLLPLAHSDIRCSLANTSVILLRAKEAVHHNDGARIRRYWLRGLVHVICKRDLTRSGGIVSRRLACEFRCVGTFGEASSQVARAANGAHAVQSDVASWNSACRRKPNRTEGIWSLREQP